MNYIKKPDNAILKEALNHFGFLLDYNKEYNTLTFANLINKYSSNPKTRALTKLLIKCPWYIVKNRFSSTLYLKL